MGFLLRVAVETVRALAGCAGEVLRSRLGLLLFLAHLALVSCAYVAHLAARPTPDGFGDPGESLVVKAVYLINTPAIFAAAVPVFGFIKERRPEEYGVLQWAAVSFILSCALFQWYFYGFLIEHALGRGRRARAAPPL